MTSARNAELVMSLGAEDVLDYTTQDFTETGERYDIVFDAVGKTTARRSRAVLAPTGSFVSVRTSKAGERIADLTTLRDLLEAGAIRAVVDRSFPLEQIADAHRYVETGRKRGNVLIMVGT